MIWQTEAYKENTFIGAYYDTASDQIFATTAGSGSAEHSGLFAIDAITGAFNQQIAFTGATPSQVGEFTSHIYQFNHVEVKDDTLLLFGYSHGYITIVGLNPFNKDTAYIPVYFKVDKNDFNNIFESWMFNDENTPISLLSGDYSELLGMNYQKFINGRNDSIQNCGGSITTNIKYKTPLVYGPKSFVDFNGAIFFISFEGPGSSYAPKLKTSYPSEICSKKIFLSYLEEVYTLDINPITDLPDYWDELTPDPNSTIYLAPSTF